MPNPILLELSEPHLTRVRVALGRHKAELEKLTKAAMERGVGCAEAYTAIAEIDALNEQLADQPSLPFGRERELTLVAEPEFEAADA